MIATVSIVGGEGAVLAYEIVERDLDAFLLAVDSAARGSGADPLCEVGESPERASASEINRRWLDGRASLLSEAQSILEGSQPPPAR